jgi:hypothetical protein
VSIEVLDPTHDDGGAAAAEFAPAERPADLAGATVGIVSNGKQNTVPFFDTIEAELRARHGVAEVVRITKGNYSAPAGDEILEHARTWHALIAGVGD